MNWVLQVLVIVLTSVVLLIYYRKRIAEDWTLFRVDKRRWLYLKWKNWGEPIVLAVILALLVRTYLIQAFKIPTGSMRPVFLENDRILVDKVTYRFQPPKRGDIIVFKFPLDEKKDFVKRLIAFGGERVRIESGHVYVDGKTVEEPESIRRNYYYNRDDWPFAKTGQEVPVPVNHYFVLGDNSIQSSDSRNWGFVHGEELIGRAILIYWPPQRIRWISHHDYVARPEREGT